MRALCVNSFFKQIDDITISASELDDKRDPFNFSFIQSKIILNVYDKL